MKCCRCSREAEYLASYTVDRSRRYLCQDHASAWSNQFACYIFELLEPEPWQPTDTWGNSAPDWWHPEETPKLVAHMEGE